MKYKFNILRIAAILWRIKRDIENNNKEAAIRKLDIAILVINGKTKISGADKEFIKQYRDKL
jgi:hypothetical protein